MKSIYRKCVLSAAFLVPLNLISAASSSSLHDQSMPLQTVTGLIGQQPLQYKALEAIAKGVIAGTTSLADAIAVISSGQIPVAELAKAMYFSLPRTETGRVNMDLFPQELLVDFAGVSIQDLIDHDMLSGVSEMHGILHLNGMHINDLTGIERLQTDESTYGLNLSDNRITSIPMGILAECPWLRGLSLAGNQITSIAPGTFAGSALTGLALDDNQVNVLASGTFTGTNIISVSLTGNPILNELAFISPIPRNNPPVDPDVDDPEEPDFGDDGSDDDDGFVEFEESDSDDDDEADSDDDDEAGDEYNEPNITLETASVA